MKSFSIYELQLSYLLAKNGMVSLPKDFMLFDSGRSALHFFLGNIAKSRKLDVYVNAYTTDVVHTTIRSLGLNMIHYDVNPYNFEAEVDLSNVGENSLFIQTGLFGFKSFNHEVYSEVKKKGGLFLEDCCNSFGTEIDGKTAGSIGDASIFSFRVGKALSSGGGALKVNNPDYQEELEEKYSKIQEISAWKSKLKQFRVFLDYLAFEPLVLKYISRPIRNLQKGNPILNNLVKGGVVDTEFKVDASNIHKMGQYQVKLANKRLANHQKEAELKKTVSNNLSKLLRDFPLHLYGVDPTNQTGWNYLFYPVLLKEGDPDEFVSHLRAHGFDATRFHHSAVERSFPSLKKNNYPGTICLIDKLVVIPNTARMLGLEKAMALAISKFFKS